MSDALPAAAARPLVVCLCAAWCGSCRDYRATFAGLATRFEGRADFAWIDVEDDADALGELDIDDFPTLFVSAGDETLFLGPVTPQPQTAERLVRGALAGELAGGGAAEPEGGTAERIRRLAGSRRA